MKRLLGLIALLVATGAFAQSAPPKAAKKPQIKPQRIWSTRGCIRGQDQMLRRFTNELRRLRRHWLGMRSPPRPLLGWSKRLRLRRGRRPLPTLQCFLGSRPTATASGLSVQLRPIGGFGPILPEEIGGVSEVTYAGKGVVIVV
jgi:hypothetical protein